MFGIVGAYHISTTGKIWKLRLWSSEKSGSIFTVTNAQKTGKKVRSAFILSVTATVQLNLDSVIYACYPIFERQALENLPYFQMPTVIHLCYVQVHHRRKSSCCCWDCSEFKILFRMGLFSKSSLVRKDTLAFEFMSHLRA